MALNKRIAACSIAVWFLLAAFALYLKFFPVIVSPALSDLLVIGLLVLLLALLAYEPFAITGKCDLALIVPQYLVFAFLVRLVPTIRLAFQPLADPYYYFICAFNIDRFGTLRPLYSGWYSSLSQQLTWPNMHLLSTGLMDLTGIHTAEFLRYVAPMTGALFFLGVFLLAREITGENRLAILAGLIACCGDTVLFYQSEYHPQGLAFVYFVFLMVFIVRHFSNPSTLNAALLVGYAIAFSFSHHFSTLFLGFFSIYMIVALALLLRFTGNGRSTASFRSLLFPWIIIPAAMFLNHIYSYPAFLEVIRSSVAYHLNPIHFLSMNLALPFQVNLLNGMKYPLLALALVSVLYIWKTRDNRELLAFIIMAGILLSGLFGMFIAFLPIDRLIGFYIPFAATFGALTLFRFRTLWLPHLHAVAKYAIILPVAVMILIAGPLNYIGPSLLLHDSQPDPYYWHANDFSEFSTYGYPGTWMGSHAARSAAVYAFGSIYGSFTYMIPYFYGEMPRTIMDNGFYSAPSSEYFIYNDRDFPVASAGVLFHEHVIYRSGTFSIGRNPASVSMQT